MSLYRDFLRLGQNWRGPSDLSVNRRRRQGFYHSHLVGGAMATLPGPRSFVLAALSFGGKSGALMAKSCGVLTGSSDPEAGSLLSWWMLGEVLCGSVLRHTHACAHGGDGHR